MIINDEFINGIHLILGAPEGGGPVLCGAIDIMTYFPYYMTYLSYFMIYFDVITYFSYFSFVSRYS